jgi:hypothetical protein
MLIYRKYYHDEDYNNNGMAVEPDDRDGKGGTRVLEPSEVCFFLVFF